MTGAAMTTENAQIQAEMRQVQADLKGALEELHREVGSKLKPAERTAIDAEFAELLEILQRLETGKVWLGIFGKTSVGKSAVINSLVGVDVARVGQKKDLTRQVTHYEKDGWMLADMPGVMGRAELQEIALEEAKRCHGHIFIIDDEPFGPELGMFEAVHEELPNTPKIVFVNKWDEVQALRTEEERAELPRLIEQTMGKFVKSPADIVYGSAHPVVDGKRVRQELPQLVERMHEDAGTLGLVMNVLHPADQASQLCERVRQRIQQVRMQVARKVISAFATASAVGGVVPLAVLLTTPGILVSMVYALCRIMGHSQERMMVRGMTIQLIKACAQELGVEFVGMAAVEVFASFATLVPGAGILALGALGATGYYRYRRTVVLGEVALEYINQGFSWGEEGPHAVIQRCRERAKAYLKLTGREIPVAA